MNSITEKTRLDLIRKFIADDTEFLASKIRYPSQITFLLASSGERHFFTLELRMPGEITRTCIELKAQEHNMFLRAKSRETPEAVFDYCNSFFLENTDRHFLLVYFNDNEAVDRTLDAIANGELEPLLTLTDEGIPKLRCLCLRSSQPALLVFAVRTDKLKTVTAVTIDREKYDRLKEDIKKASAEENVDRLLELSNQMVDDPEAETIPLYSYPV